jgi:UDP-glucuronate 4-epimerase
MSKILVTGAAGFIGFHLSKRLLERGDEVVGLDSLNEYYDVNLKIDRIKHFAMDRNFKPVRMDLADREGMVRLFAEEKFDMAVNLAAQAGVRYSLKNPYSYVSKAAGITA